MQDLESDAEDTNEIAHMRTETAGMQSGDARDADTAGALEPANDRYTGCEDENCSPRRSAELDAVDTGAEVAAFAKARAGDEEEGLPRNQEEPASREDRILSTHMEQDTVEPLFGRTGTHLSEPLRPNSMDSERVSVTPQRTNPKPSSLVHSVSHSPSAAVGDVRTPGPPREELEEERRLGTENGRKRPKSSRIRCDRDDGAPNPPPGNDASQRERRGPDQVAASRSSRSTADRMKPRAAREDEDHSVAIEDDRTGRDADMESSAGVAEPVEPTYGLAVARESELDFQHVQAVKGKVSVANALCVNSSYTGVLCVPPRTDTGAQRALKGDEIFYVHSGHVNLEIHDHRYVLYAGDHVAIPHMACYAFQNGGPRECRLVFFVPRNPFG
jgi:mannose-6-phosphate isomerase-like protein (cupin superfamily)